MTELLFFNNTSISVKQAFIFFSTVVHSIITIILITLGGRSIITGQTSQAMVTDWESVWVMACGV